MIFSSSECLTWLAVFLTVSVAIATVNLLLIILFTKNRSLRTRAMYLVINLAVVDMLVGVFSSLFSFRSLLYDCNIVNTPHLITLELTIIIDFLFFWFHLTSLTNITVISVERMHATIRPFRHRCIKKLVYGVTIAIVWVSAVMLSTAIVILRQWSYIDLCVWQSYSCLCLFVICVSYSSIAVKFLCAAHPQHHRAASRQKKLTVTLFVMTIVSLLMFLPYAAATFHVLSSSNISVRLSVQELVRLDLSLRILYFMNSFFNPFFYIIRIPEFRRAFLVLFKRQQRRNANVYPLRARGNVRC